MKKSLLFFKSDYNKDGYNIKKGSYVVSKLGLLFIAFTYDYAGIIAEGNLPYDLKEEKYKVVSDEEASKIVAWIKDPVKKAKSLESEKVSLEKEKASLEARIKELEKELVEEKYKTSAVNKDSRGETKKESDSVKTVNAFNGTNKSPKKK